jgi:hypothetical protein
MAIRDDIETIKREGELFPNPKGNWEYQRTRKWMYTWFAIALILGFALLHCRFEQCSLRGCANDSYSLSPSQDHDPQAAAA